MKFVRKFFAILLAAAVCAAAHGAEKATPDEAKAMLTKAVAYLKANGKDKALAQFNDKQGGFVDRDLYVTVIDTSGKTLAHPFNPRLIGKSNIEIEDADGKAFYKERVEIAKAKGHGQQEYKVINPVTKAIEPKLAFFERIDDVIVVTGVFKP
jgi:signal transduction histidine kinase